MEVLNNYQREKLDESNDEEFYSDPKFVYHLDSNFRQNLSDLYEREIDNYSTVLDLLVKDEIRIEISSSNLPLSFTFAEVEILI